MVGAVGITTPEAAGVHPATPDAAAVAAVAYWATGPGTGELRPATVAPPRPGEVLVRTSFTGVSRGTEALIARGEVPASEHARMRAPLQEGEFPFPVKYGYLSVGVVEGGPTALRGRAVFALAPHQSAYVVPADAVTPVPDGVPLRRAVLAGAVETAVNVLWDAQPVLGDRVTVVGAGMIGSAVARLAAGIPGVAVELVDVDPAKAAVATRLGVGFAEPAGAARDRDVVIEASGHPDGLALALEVVATDGEVVVASWYGARPASVPLGADFHARRLTIRSTQVGAVAPRRRERRTARERLALALGLLVDPAFDALLGGGSRWRALPEVLAGVAAGSAGAMCTTIDWSGAP